MSRGPKGGQSGRTGGQSDAEDDDGEATNRSERFDPIKSETLNILGDLIDLQHNPKTATASTSK